jgi:hypothetical protein
MSRLSVFGSWLLVIGFSCRFAVLGCSAGTERQTKNYKPETENQKPKTKN